MPLLHECRGLSQVPGGSSPLLWPTGPSGIHTALQSFKALTVTIWLPMAWEVGECYCSLKIQDQNLQNQKPIYNEECPNLGLSNGTTLQRTNTENSKKNIPRKGILRPQSQFPNSCVCERFIYSHDQSAYSVARKYMDRFWEYINSSQHRHMNVEIGTEAAQFPEKEYINGIFFAVCSSNMVYITRANWYACRRQDYAQKCRALADYSVMGPGRLSDCRQR